ncbi:MAG: FimV/HubP family polar landmark protein [Pseudomonadota bacterium]
MRHFKGLGIIGLLLALPILVQADTYGPIKSGEGMWAVAGKTRPDKSIGRYQMMMALLTVNPQAFGSPCNINTLKAGASLTIPTQEAILSVSEKEARAGINQKRCIQPEITPPEPGVPESTQKDELQPIKEPETATPKLKAIEPTAKREVPVSKVSKPQPDTIDDVKPEPISPKEAVAPKPVAPKPSKPKEVAVPETPDAAPAQQDGDNSVIAFELPRFSLVTDNWDAIRPYILAGVAGLIFILLLVIWWDRRHRREFKERHTMSLKSPSAPKNQASVVEPEAYPKPQMPEYPALIPVNRPRDMQRTPLKPPAFHEPPIEPITLTYTPEFQPPIRIGKDAEKDELFLSPTLWEDEVMLETMVDTEMDDLLPPDNPQAQDEEDIPDAFDDQDFDLLSDDEEEDDLDDAALDDVFSLGASPSNENNTDD